MSDMDVFFFCFLGILVGLAISSIIVVRALGVF